MDKMSDLTLAKFGTNEWHLTSVALPWPRVNLAYQSCTIFKILPNIQNFAGHPEFCQFPKFCAISRILLHFQIFAQFPNVCPIFKILPKFQNCLFQNVVQFLKFWPISKNFADFHSISRIPNFARSH